MVFEYEKDIEAGEQPFICHETNSKLYNYYISDEKALDKNANIHMGVYDDVAFADENTHLTTRAVSRIGVKNFPGIGGIGFYKDAYSEDSRILAPIHPKTEAYQAPVLTTAEIVDGKLHVVITPPANLRYTCYRIIARQGAFACEYITYKEDYTMDAPFALGEYTVYCMGYDENNGTVSEDSNELILTVPTGLSDWGPHDTDIDDLTARVDDLEDAVGDIGSALDTINGEVI